jgi:hypothetical protein
MGAGPSQNVWRAVFPMRKIKAGAVQQRPPFDVQELLKQIEQATKD